MPYASQRVPWSKRANLDDRETPGGAWAAGYTIGNQAEEGDSLPHPTGWTHDFIFYNALRAALRPRGLDVSMFMVTVPKGPTRRYRTAAGRMKPRGRKVA